MPTLISPGGQFYRSETPLEITRLRARGYTFEGEPVVSFADTQFHPVHYAVKEVLDYIEAHPEDADRVIAEEKSGKARVSIVGE